MLELNKKDRRWYKWVSILGFCLLCQELRIIIYYKKKDFNEYFSYIAIIVYLFILVRIYNSIKTYFLGRKEKNNLVFDLIYSKYEVEIYR